MDNTFVAAAAFVLGETLRLRSQAIDVPPGALETQREVLEERARLLLEASAPISTPLGRACPLVKCRRVSHWRHVRGVLAGLDGSTAARPGEALDREGWRLYVAEYRGRLRELAEPLLRSALRYWELTLLMVERVRAPGPWSDRIRDNLQSVRDRIGIASDGDAASGGS